MRFKRGQAVRIGAFNRKHGDHAVNHRWPTAT
jgi:hypothetical protein